MIVRVLASYWDSLMALFLFSKSLGLDIVPMC